MKDIIDPIFTHFLVPCKSVGDESAFSTSERKKVLEKLLAKTFFTQNSEDHMRSVKGMTRLCKFLLETNEWETLEADLLDETAGIYNKSMQKNDDSVKELLQKFRIDEMGCDPEADAECMEQLYGKAEVKEENSEEQP